MQREARPVVIQPEIGERHVANDSVNAVLGQAGVAEMLDTDVVAGVQHASDLSGEAVKLHADEAHAGRSQGNEVTDPTARLQHGRIGGHAQVPERRVHGLDDHGRGVEGGEGGTPGAGVVLGREQRPELLPERLPGRILVAAGDRVREDPQGQRAEAGEAQEDLALVRGGGPLRLLDGLERADCGQEGASFGFVAAGGVGRLGARRRCRHLEPRAVAGGRLVEVHVADNRWVW